MCNRGKYQEGGGYRISEILLSRDRYRQVSETDMGNPLMNKIYLPKAKKDPKFIYTKYLVYKRKWIGGPKMSNFFQQL